MSTAGWFVLLTVLGSSLGLLWWQLDRLVRSRMARINKQRAVRVIKIAPTLAGPHRTGGGGEVRIDETEDVIVRLKRTRRLIRYVFATPLILIVLAIVVITDGALLEVLGDLEAWRRADRDFRSA
jgi:hypothetical protein